LGCASRRAGLSAGGGSSLAPASLIQTASDAGNADALVFFLFDLPHLDGETISTRPVVAVRAAFCNNRNDHARAEILLDPFDRRRRGGLEE
jgi:hypothetical protein